MTHLAKLPLRAEPAQDGLTHAPTLLRFITCGSVDDGKSTLIGRLLADTGNVPDDQLQVLADDSRRFGTRAGEVDYALLLDGLAAEREQGITIDVAHRHFATPRRAFIVADTPGHRQYTRNMATGASRADLAIVLVDARQGIIEQTRRHIMIAGLMGIGEVVLAVNKMDLAGFSQAAFDAIVRDYRTFAPGSMRITAIPLCARDGDMVTRHGERMGWYDGPTLLDHLEQVEVGVAKDAAPLRMPVQMALRPDDSFRGCAGMLAAGCVAPGDAVTILPSGRTTTVLRVATADGDLRQAVAGQSVTLVLADALDVARGSMIVAAAAPATMADWIEVRVLWSGDTPLDPARKYLLKLGTATVGAQLSPPRRGLDTGSGRMTPIDGLAQNGIADLQIQLDRSIPVDRYADSRSTGGLIVMDPHSNETVAMGTVTGIKQTSWRTALAAVPQPSEHGWRSLAKAATWRAAGSVDTFLLAWLFTGNAKLAAGIGGTEVFTKVALYYLHERAWARLRFGLRKVPGAYEHRPRS